ncbi:MAG TPA: GntP family permease [Syntrophomonadaceae bacterium]|nr:GntP family permease [Syntrophomonadaceae bacterium]
MEWLGPVGICIGIILLIIASYRGVNIIVTAPIAAAIIILSNGMNIKEGLFASQGSYMAGLGGFVVAYFIIFVLGSILGKYLEDSKATYTIANSILQITGKDNAYAVLIAIAAVGAVLSYGGISVFIVVFTLAPLARPLFKELNIAWHLFIAAFFAGVGTFTMSMLPGTPAIQNVIPTQLGTTLTAAPLMSIVCSVVIIAFSLLYMKWQLNLSIAAGEGYEPVGQEMRVDLDPDELPSLGAAITPLILLIAIILVGSSLKVPDIIIPALLIAIISAAILLNKHLPQQLSTLNEGAVNAVKPAFFTAAAVGVGSITVIAPGFKVILDAISGLPGGTLVEVISITGLLSVVTASPSGALGIVIPAFGETWLASGIAPEVIHRVAAIASGAFGAMPHCGVVFGIMAVTGLTHRQVFRHFFSIGGIGGFIALITAVLMSFFY